MNSISIATSSKATGKFQRSCPAFNAFITTADCGAHRGRDIACPDNCAYSVLNAANPQRRFEAQARLVHKLLDRVQEQQRNTIVEFTNQFSDKYPQPNQKVISSFFFNLALSVLLYQPLPDGRNGIDVWEQEGWTNLNNDEVLLMGCLRRSYCTILEVKNIRSKDEGECVDLLAPGTPAFLCREEEFFLAANRLGRYLVWVVPYPNGHGLSAEVDSIIPSCWKTLIGEFEADYARALATESGLSRHTFLSRECCHYFELNEHLTNMYYDRLELQNEEDEKSPPDPALLSLNEAAKHSSEDNSTQVKRVNDLWLTLPHKDLDQKSPVQAAAMPEMRARLIDAVRDKIYSTQNIVRTLKVAYDPADHLIETLDLTELK